MTEGVTVMCGGVGAARFLSGVVQVVDPAHVSAVVNTADDTVINGLAVSPDLDTIVYTVAQAIDPQRGWGLAGETWNTLAALERYERIRPDGSDAATTWFGLGDRDLATHLYRTARLAEGATLTTVTAEIARAWGLEIRVLPMSDQPVRTRLSVRDGTEIGFQEYFVRHRHEVPVSSVRFVHDGARPTADVLAAVRGARTVVLAPSNPIVSIGPMRSLTGIDEALAARRRTVVAVSPLVAGRALKGPADRMLAELGHEPTVLGVARLYRDVAGTLVIDPADAALAPAIEEAGMRVVVVPSVMSTPQIAAALARATLAAA